MKYFIRFKCPIVEDLRPEGFPREVYASIAASVSSFEELVAFIDRQLFTMINNGGVICWPDEATKETAEQIYEKRLFVPMHMIAFISHEIKALADPKGVLAMRPTTMEDAENLDAKDPNPPTGQENLPS